MEPAEFEEKEYEGPLYNQLLFGNHRISTPGQVFENAFGLDAALEAEHPLFWDLFNYKNIPNGIHLRDYKLGWIWRRYGKYRDLPNFPLNLLIQAKRPDYLLGRNSNLARHGINKDYWRFQIRKHQQPLLSRIERQLRNRALVVYASPAFHKLHDLDECTENQNIVENSTFVRPSRLDNHRSWNYNQPGTHGVATTESEFIKDDLFYNQLSNKLLDIPIDTNPIDDLKLLKKTIINVVEGTQDNPISVSYLRKINRLKEIIKNEELILYYYIRLFFEMIDTTWLVASNDN